MTDRNASATIKGYFYQFDQTIVRLLEASEHASVVVEGIEDIDVDDGAESALVQCKYYEGSEYNHSLIKEAIIHMIRHFHASGCPSDHVLRYRLYGHYKSGHSKLMLPLTSALMKDSFLSYTRDKVAHRVHEELGMSDAQIDIFCTLLEINIHGQSYEDQQNKLVKLLVEKINGCTDADAMIFYYPSAINVIRGLAIQADPSK